jgi:hypothetical protein
LLNAGACALGFFELRDPGFTFARRQTGFVEHRVVAFANHSAVGENGGRLVGDGGCQKLRQFGRWIQMFLHRTQSRRGSTRECVTQSRKRLQSVSQRDQIARVALPGHGARNQALDVAETAQKLAYIAAQQNIAKQFGNRLLAIFDARLCQQRL